MAYNLESVAQAAAIAKNLEGDQALATALMAARTAGTFQLTANLLLMDDQGAPVPTANLPALLATVMNDMEEEILDLLTAKIQTRITTLSTNLGITLNAAGQDREYNGSQS